MDLRVIYRERLKKKAKKGNLGFFILVVKKELFEDNIHSFVKGFVSNTTPLTITTLKKTSFSMVVSIGLVGLSMGSILFTRSLKETLYVVLVQNYVPSLWVRKVSLPN